MGYGYIINEVDVMLLKREVARLNKVKRLMSPIDVIFADATHDGVETDLGALTDEQREEISMSMLKAVCGVIRSVEQLTWVINEFEGRAGGDNGPSGYADWMPEDFMAKEPEAETDDSFEDLGEPVRKSSLPVLRYLNGPEELEELKEREGRYEI